VITDPAIIGNEDCAQTHLAGTVVTLDCCPREETCRIDDAALADRAPARVSSLEVLVDTTETAELALHHSKNFRAA